MAFGDPQTSGGQPAEPNPQISANAELITASAAMLIKGFWEHCERLPDASDFDDGELFALWTAIIEARKRGPLSRHAVSRQLREMGWDEKDCFRALKRVDATYLTLADSLDAVKFLLDRRLRKQAGMICAETLKELGTTADVQATVQRHEKAIADVASTHDGGGDGWLTGDEIKADTKERLETGLEDLDRVSGGLPVSDLTILAGRPGMGKTALALVLARNVARSGSSVGFYSLEMETIDLIQRGACTEAYAGGHFSYSRTQNPYYDVAERGQLEGEMRRRYEAGERQLRERPIFWDDRKGRTIDQIWHGGRRLKARCDRERRPLKLLIVDHLLKIRVNGRGRDGNRHQELAVITDDLCSIAGELGVAMVSLCQLSRKVEEREDKRPQLQDLRESGSIEENAHTVLFCYRPAYYDDEARERGEKLDDDRVEREKHILEIAYGKNRGGERKRVKVFTDIGCNAILDAKMAPGLQAAGGLL